MKHPSFFADWNANKDLKIRCVMVMFRISSRLWRSGPLVRVLGIPWLAFYRALVEWTLGIELSWRAEIGAPFFLYHGVGVVVHNNSRLGARCVIRQCTTLGTRGPGGGAPVLGDGVEVGCNAVILGSVRIGNQAVIGAGSVVVHDVPEGAIVAGNPARIIRMKDGFPPPPNAISRP